MKIPVPFSGGCLCGAIRYECEAEPIQMFLCHCRNCQQAGGGAYTPAILVPKSALKITGEPAYFSSPSLANGLHTRGFCADCGARLFGAVSPDWEFIGVVAGSLDDPSWFQPACHIFVSDAQPWDIIDPALPKHETYFPM
jgi:hypothetical protein